MGFVVQLDSSSFPGAKCFFFKKEHGQWCNILEKHLAWRFDSRLAAEQAIHDTMRKIRYQAPELNGNLAARLRAAEVVPA